MRTADLWIMPGFLGGGVYVRAKEDEAGAIQDGLGLWWKPRTRARLVQPDNPDERGAHTIVWREPITLEQRLAALSAPPANAPEDISAHFEALPKPEPEPVPLLALDRVPVKNWRRIELPRPERKSDAP